MNDPRVSDMTLPLADRIAAARPGQAVPVTQEEFALIRNRAQPQPSDLNRFKALFDSVGLKLEFTTAYIADGRIFTDGSTLPQDASFIHLNNGVGYDGFVCDFYFDAAGKFVSHGVWK